MKGRFVAVVLGPALCLAVNASAQQSAEEKANIRLNRILTATLVVTTYETDGQKGLLRSTWKHQYDSKGNLLFQLVLDNEDSLEPTVSSTYTYDDQNRVVEYVAGGRSQRVSYVESGGAVSEMKILNGDGTVRERHAYQRNAAGKLIEDQSYGPTGAAGNKRTYAHDSRGNMYEYTEVAPDGKVVLKKVHTFNDKGNATQTVQYGPDGRQTGKTTYAYDSQDRLKERCEFDNTGKLTSRSVYERDARGLVTRETRYNGAGVRHEVTETSYTFFPSSP